MLGCVYNGDYTEDAKDSIRISVCKVARVFWWLCQVLVRHNRACDKIFCQFVSRVAGGEEIDSWFLHCNRVPKMYTTIQNMYTLSALLGRDSSSLVSLPGLRHLLPGSLLSSSLPLPRPDQGTSVDRSSILPSSDHAHGFELALSRVKPSGTAGCMQAVASRVTRLVLCVR